MQKKLIAAAVAALVTTGAMADATVYGRLDFGYRTTDTENNDNAGGTVEKKSVSNTAWNVGSLTTSRLGWNVKEDLGGGMSAFGNLELGINNLATSGADPNGAGTPFNTRTAYVGLKSDSAGSVTIGRQWVLVDQVMGVGSVGGLNNTTGNWYNQGGLAINAAGDITGLTTGKLNNTRSGNLITYSSPNFSGFSFAAQIGQGETDSTPTGVAADAEQSEFGLMAKFATGPLTVAFGYSSEEMKSGAAGTTVSEPTQMALAGTYDLGVAKIYALYADGEDKKLDLDPAAADTAFLNGRDGLEIGAQFPLGATKLFVSYFTGESDFGGVSGGTAFNAKVDHTGYQLGALYSLSKRTTAYAIYGAAEAEDKIAPVTKFEETTLALGIRHDF